MVAAWNGLAISALAECALALGQPDLLETARAAATLLAEVHMKGDRLMRTSRGGRAGDTEGALEDYACVAEGFGVLSGVTGEGRWLTLAGRLLDAALGAFGDGAGGFFDTAADGEPLIFRPADAADNATPSGTFAMAGALLSYAALTGSARHREAAEAALGVLPAIAARYPRAAGAGLAVAEAWLAGPAEIAVVGHEDDERTRVLHQTALLAAPPGAVLALGDGNPKTRETVPLADRPRAGRRGPGRVRLPGVHLPGAGHHPGAAQGDCSTGRSDWTPRNADTALVVEADAPDNRRRAAAPGPSIGTSSLLAVSGAVGVVLATAGGKPAGTTASHPPVPATRPPAAAGARPVVPLLGAKHRRRPGRARAVSSTPAAGPGSARVAPLHGLRQADLLVVAPFSLPGRVLAAVSRQPGVTSADPIEAARVTINGAPQAVLGVDPSAFRGYAGRPTAASDALWQGVADGGVAVSYTMGTLDKLALGGAVTVTGRQAERLRVVAFGTVGIGGVDAVVSDSVARSLGMPASNAIVISAPPASVTALAARIRGLLPRGAAVEPLVTLTTAPSQAGVPASEAAGGGLTAAQLTAALRAAESRQGLPYAWGAAGQAAFDCSGLVQWSFAQAGVALPRTAADQARTGPAVPVSQLEPGDLLFYHTDPTAPGYISHVAIYLGNGWMIQAPQPGLRVQVVPADFGSQFAGAIRVSPRIAAAVAGGLA